MTCACTRSTSSGASAPSGCTRATKPKQENTEQELSLLQDAPATDLPDLVALLAISGAAPKSGRLRPPPLGSLVFEAYPVCGGPFKLIHHLPGKECREQRLTRSRKVEALWKNCPFAPSVVWRMPLPTWTVQPQKIRKMARAALEMNGLHDVALRVLKRLCSA